MRLLVSVHSILTLDFGAPERHHLPKRQHWRSRGYRWIWEVRIPLHQQAYLSAGFIGRNMLHCRTILMTFMPQTRRLYEQLVGDENS
jgi:hypothetical protein